MEEKKIDYFGIGEGCQSILWQTATKRANSQLSATGILGFRRTKMATLTLWFFCFVVVFEDQTKWRGSTPVLGLVSWS